MSLYCVQEQKEPVSSVSECKRDGELSTLRLRLCIDIADGCNTGARSKMSLERWIPKNGLKYVEKKNA